jgi:hypothetical protein
MKLDTQATEILGRNALVNELVRAGLEVALPIRDRGVDLIIYSDRPDATQNFSAIAIQMKAASKKSFSINIKFARTAQLLIVYVWEIATNNPRSFAVTYPQALKIATDCKFTETKAWLKGGSYVVGMPSKKLEKMLSEFEMTPESWRKLFRSEVQGEKQR